MENFLGRFVPHEIRATADLCNPPQVLLEKGAPPCGAILFAFYFSGLPWPEGQRLLRLAASRARHVHIADFSIPERNLELAPHFLARLLFAGREQFWRRGGIGNFVLQSGLRILERRPLMGRMAQLIMVLSK